MKIDVKILDPRLMDHVPCYATVGSAGFDLRACVESSIVLQPDQTYLVPSGFAMALEPGYAGFIFPRSGLGHRGLVLGNLTGVIDCDYRGQVMISCWNRSNVPLTIDPLDRIAQLVVMEVAQVRFNIVSELDDSARDQGGFGSTGAS